MHSTLVERRSGIERRHRSLRAYWFGARTPRRRAGRRATDSIYPIIDWHPARVFAWVLAILLLCVSDGVLTVFLISNGAVEVNPFMALFVPHQLGWFATIKVMSPSSTYPDSAPGCVWRPMFTPGAISAMPITVS